jgi:hypothetical protein
MSFHIRSDGKNPVEFKTDEGRSSFALAIDDSVADAVWVLEIFVKKGESSGWDLLGAIETIAPNASSIGTYRNRIVAICSVPGARNWQIRPRLLSGTLLPGKSGATAMLSCSAIDFPAQGCCPITTIAGASLPATSGIEGFETGVKDPVATVSATALGGATNYRRGIIVQAPKANSDTLIYIVGTSSQGVGQGIELEAGRKVKLELSNLANVYVIANAAGAKALWLGLQ